MATETGMKTFGPLAINTKILTLALARIVDSFGNSFLIVVLPLYIASDSVTGGTYGLNAKLITGIILSLFGFFNSSLQPFTGRSSERLGRPKLFVLIGLVVLATTNFVYSLTHSYATLLITRIVQRIAVAFTVPATVALVNELSTIENRGGN